MYESVENYLKKKSKRKLKQEKEQQNGHVSP